LGELKEQHTHTHKTTNKSIKKEIKVKLAINLEMSRETQERSSVITDEYTFITNEEIKKYNADDYMPLYL
jgi:hypothetical protein